VTFAPDSKTWAVGSQFGLVKLYDCETGRETATLSRFDVAANQAFSVRFSPDGKMLATGDAVGIVRIFDIPAGIRAREDPQPSEPLLSHRADRGNRRD
jgi:WD40 repeat protein